jgi:hypothetical protein
MILTAAKQNTHKFPLSREYTESYILLSELAQQGPTELPLPEIGSDSREELLKKTNELIDLHEFRLWFPPIDVNEMKNRLMEIVDSPLLVDDRQRAEQIRHLLLKETEKIFTAEYRNLLAKRLLHQSRLLLRMGQEDFAKAALAASEALADPDRPYQSIPFAAEYLSHLFYIGDPSEFVKAMKAKSQAPEEPENKEIKDSAIITKP